MCSGHWIPLVGTPCGVSLTKIDRRNDVHNLSLDLCYLPVSWRLARVFPFRGPLELKKYFQVHGHAVHELGNLELRVPLSLSLQLFRELHITSGCKLCTVNSRASLLLSASGIESQERGDNLAFVPMPTSNVRTRLLKNYRRRSCRGEVGNNIGREFLDIIVDENSWRCVGSHIFNGC